VTTQVEATSFTRVDWAPVPRVDLLPPEINEGRNFRRLQRRLAAAVVLTVVVAGAAVAWSQQGVSGAQGGLDQIQVSTQALKAQSARYAMVPRQLAALDTARAAREQALGRDLPWYRLLTDLDQAAPAGTSLTSLSLTITDAPAGVGAATLPPLVTAGIGQVSVVGSTGDFEGVTAWLRAVAEVSGLSEATLLGASSTAPAGSAAAPAGDGAGTVSFTATLVITPEALSHRFDRKAG